MLGRPNLYTSYQQETQLLPTYAQKIAMGMFLTVLVLMPFDLPVINQLPLVRFLGNEEWLRVIAEVMIIAIAALGLNILSGLAGQVSLGHAFFMGAGACTAAYLGGEAGPDLWGHGLPIWIWLPAAAIVPALIGIVIAPVAVRLRGLYLAIVTLGLVFVGRHLGTMSWGRKIAGAPEVGREFPELDIRLWKEETPLINMSDDTTWLWFEMSENQKRYWLALAILAVSVLIAKNITRTRTGRALQAIRDRDVAAEIMGVPEARYKVIAFAVSSAFAGVGGALFASLTGLLLSNAFNLFLSVELIAILLIGGAGSTTGALMGATFVILSPELIEQVTKWLDKSDSGLFGAISDFVLTGGESGDFGFVSTGFVTQGWPMSVFDWNIALYGVLLIVFLIFEPLGLFGIWVKVRNYWKRWPFSY